MKKEKSLFILRNDNKRQCQTAYNYDLYKDSCMNLLSPPPPFIQVIVCMNE